MVSDEWLVVSEICLQVNARCWFVTSPQSRDKPAPTVYFCSGEAGPLCELCALCEIPLSSPFDHDHDYSSFFLSPLPLCASVLFHSSLARPSAPSPPLCSLCPLWLIPFSAFSLQPLAFSQFLIGVSGTLGPGLGHFQSRHLTGASREAINLQSMTVQNTEVQIG